MFLYDIINTFIGLIFHVKRCADGKKQTDDSTLLANRKHKLPLMSTKNTRCLASSWQHNIYLFLWFLSTSRTIAQTQGHSSRRHSRRQLHRRVSVSLLMFCAFDCGRASTMYFSILCIWRRNTASSSWAENSCVWALLSIGTFIYI